jgi:predicted Fe-Mo cluster-binding NifX family protein
MHYHQAPESGAHQQSQQFSVSPDLLLSNELKIKYRKLDPCTTDEINILLLENISSKAVKIFKDAGFNVIDIISNSFLIIFQG